MKRRNTKRNSQLGFSLVEMLVVLLVMSILMAAVVQGIKAAQARSTTEQTKLDQFQEAREAMDQITRDLHQAGYPNAHLLSSAVTSTSANNAVGLVKVAADELILEGDVDNDGNVESVHYKLLTTGTGCPCLQRSQVTKVAGTVPLSQGATTTMYTAVSNVLNGTTADPIFKAYTTGGTAVATPVDFTSASIADVTSVTVTLKVQGTVADVQTKLLPQTNLMGTIVVRNCSAAATGRTKSCSSS
jgi:prepilin-type N-terminal cleavage/methylation domain-containing protein